MCIVRPADKVEPRRWPYVHIYKNVRRHVRLPDMADFDASDIVMF